jgi:uncharacterized protein (TIGR03067 family)
MRRSRILVACGLVFLGASCLLPASGGRAAGGKEKGKAGPVVTAMELTKEYANDAAGFNKKYKGKELVVEGLVTSTNTQGIGEKGRLILLQGYQKPKEAFSYSVRIPATAEFDGIRIGHKVRVRGVCQGHKDTLLAAELRDAKLVRVFVADYPPSAAVKAELKKLRGDWKVAGAETKGKKLTAKDIGIEGFNIQGRELRLNITGGAVGYLGLVLDPGKKPATMDWVNPDDSRTLTIYELKGDRLRFGLPVGAKGPKGAKRPEGFDTAKNAVLVITAERAKATK